MCLAFVSSSNIRRSIFPKDMHIHTTHCAPRHALTSSIISSNVLRASSIFSVRFSRVPILSGALLAPFLAACSGIATGSVPLSGSRAWLVTGEPRAALESLSQRLCVNRDDSWLPHFAPPPALTQGAGNLEQRFVCMERSS